MNLPPVRERGLTLIELIMTIAILAILAGISAPYIGNYISRSAMRSLNADFTFALQRARAEAVNRNACATICMSANAGAASPTCTTSGEDWGRGWIVFANPTCNAAVTSADPLPGNILLVRESSGTRYTISNLNPGLRSITFNARGATMSASSGFALADSGSGADAKLNQTICIDALGRVRTLNAASTC